MIRKNKQNSIYYKLAYLFTIPEINNTNLFFIPNKRRGLIKTKNKCNHSKKRKKINL